jgi:hypothetical protein
LLTCETLDWRMYAPLRSKKRADSGLSLLRRLTVGKMLVSTLLFLIHWLTFNLWPISGCSRSSPWFSLWHSGLW